jgi:hypothetical protein
VMNVMSGMRVAAKVESSRARLGASIDLVLRLFDAP